MKSDLQIWSSRLTDSPVDHVEGVLVDIIRAAPLTFDNICWQRVSDDSFVRRLKEQKNGYCQEIREERNA